MAAVKNSSKIRSGNAGRTVSGEKNSKMSGKKKLLWTMIAIGVVLLISLIVFIVIKLPKVLYTENERFAFRKLEIDTTGYWKGKEELLLKRVDLPKGKNIFTIDLAKIRKQLENISSIESAQVRVVFPDTLKFRITERVPRARLIIGRKTAYLDKDAKMMNPEEVNISHQRLPQVIHMRNPEQLKSAMQLIMDALNDYPDIVIQRISLAKPDEMRVDLFYRRAKQCTVYFPAREDSDYLYLLSVLQTTILGAGSDWKTFDLRFRGSVTGQ